MKQSLQPILDFAHRFASRRLLRVVPVVGVAVGAVYAYRNAKQKGALRGGVDAALDMTPVIGRAKGLVELFTQDLIPPRAARARKEA